MGDNNAMVLLFKRVGPFFICQHRCLTDGDRLRKARDSPFWLLWFCRWI